MAYKPKKKQLNQKPKPEPEKFDSGDDYNEPLVIETEVENHPVIDDVPFSQKARQKLEGFIQNVAEGEDGSAGEDKPKKKYYYNSYARKKEKERQSELGNLITSILVITVTAAPMNEALKPNEDEIGVVSMRVANILWRHNILTGKLSGDALDGIAILAVTAEYWQRTKPERERLRAERAASSGLVEYTEEREYQDTNIPSASPISPFLDKLATESEES